MTNGLPGRPPLDITFRTEEGRFNYRVCGVMLHGDRLLVMRDERSPYYYLPGGRVQINEPAEQAVVREIQEELGVQAAVDRPLWLSQSFFEEDVSGETYHELCLYFLMDVSKTDLTERDSFSGVEKRHRHVFRWMPLDRVREEYLYPTFIKQRIFQLPEHLELVTEFA